LHNQWRKGKNFYSQSEFELNPIVKVKTGDVKEQLIPSDHKHVLARFHQASPQLLEKVFFHAIF